MKNKYFVSALLLAVLLPTTANAAFPAGQWKVDLYSDRAGTATTVDGFCIKANGTWYLTTAGSEPWSGFWVMKGNDIRFHGNNKALTWSDSGELSRVSSTLLTGYWQAWPNGEVGNYWWVAKWSFTSATCAAPA